jgi:SNF2 family DNA or RNA helicase
MIVAYSNGRICLVPDTRFSQEASEVLFRHKFRFNRKLGAFVGPYLHLDELEHELEWATGEKCIRNFESDAHQKWLETVKELKMSRRSPDWSLLKYPPIVGKPPFEEYQKIDIGRALCSNRHYFAWDLGLGKSYAAATIIENLKVKVNLGKTLVFSTRIGTYNLANELRKFGKTLENDKILTISSVGELENRAIFEDDFDILVAPYDVLKYILGHYYDLQHATKQNPHPSRTVKFRNCPVDFEKWLNGKPGCLILDEAHSLANVGTWRYRVFEMTAPFFEYRYFFSGTPADQYDKLYAQLRLMDFSIVHYMSFDEWAAYYNEVGNKWNPNEINPTKWKLGRIKELDNHLSRFYFVRRKREDCIELPPNIEVPTITMDMGPEQRAIYEDFSNFVVSEAAKERGAAALVKSMFPYLLLSCENPKVIENGDNFNTLPEELKHKIKKFNYNKQYRKLDALDAIIEEELEEKELKGIIWTAHPLTTEFIAKRYAKFKPFVLGSSVPSSERLPLIEEFKISDSKMLIASIYVANTSVTITECKWECFLEKVMKYSDYYQSRGRIWRNGQTDETHTYSLAYDKSLDSFIEENLRRKGELLESLFAGQTVTQQALKAAFNHRLTS